MNKDKFDLTITTIRAAHYLYVNKCYIGVSGGKDSIIVAHMVHKYIDSKIPIVFNMWEPFDIELLITIKFLSNAFRTKNLIMTSPPKSNGIEIAKYLGYKAQFDGTRIAEATRTDGKSTTFFKDGKDISRTEMESMVENGLGGLTFVYPIFDWSDQDVFDYLKEHKLDWI